MHIKLLIEARFRHRMIRMRLESKNLMMDRQNRKGKDISFFDGEKSQKQSFSSNWPLLQLPPFSLQRLRKSANRHTQKVQEVSSEIIPSGSVNWSSCFSFWSSLSSATFCTVFLPLFLAMWTFFLAITTRKSLISYKIHTDAHNC